MSKSNVSAENLALSYLRSLEQMAFGRSTTRPILYPLFDPSLEKERPTWRSRRTVVID